MNRRFLLLVLFLCLLSFPIAAFSQWQNNGNPICTATYYQSGPVMCADGSGGTLIAWSDQRSGNNDIYVQRINSLGVIMWTVNGVVVESGSFWPTGPAICADGLGGAFIAWGDTRNDNTATYDDIFAQHITSTGQAQWIANGLPICTAVSEQYDVHLVTDTLGGVIIAWEDSRSGTSKIFAQRVDGSGTIVWAANGVQLCNATGQQLFGTSFATGGSGNAVISDGNGGLIATWEDHRNGVDYDVYAQRITQAGSLGWPAAGVAVCTATGSQLFPVVAQGGSIGVAIITWLDLRDPNRAVYAQLVDAAGTPQWTANGVVVGVNAYLNTLTDATIPDIAPDGFGGAIIAYNDNHQTGTSDIFAQRINPSGFTQWIGAGVTVCSAAGNQYWPRIIMDGFVGAFITWEDARNGIDKDIYAQRLNQFGSQQWGIDGAPVCTAATDQVAPVIAPSTTNGAVIAWTDSRGVPTTDIYATRIAGPNTPTGSNIAVPLGNPTTPDAVVTYQNVYSAGTTSLTLSTSCSSATPANFTVVGSVCYDVTTNVGFTGNVQVCLHYNDTSLPGPESALRVLHYLNSQWVDVTTSLDTSANTICGTVTTLSPFVVGFGSVTGVGDSPRTFALNQNVPNPFNPTTIITYDVPQGGARVSIGVYDAAGRLVRTLLNEARPAGRFSVDWDGRDESGHAVASGVYFYRMAARDFIETRKMVLLK